MAFLFLLSLALTTIVNLEVSLSSTSAAKNQARENARFGLLVALGQLQQATGPDQRVTAEANIFTPVSDDPNALGDIVSPHWMGVWDSTTENWKNLTPAERIAQARWLVSGNSQLEITDADYLTPSTKLNSFTDEQKVVMVHDTSRTNNDVTVIKESVGGQSSGNFAYWIADENMKARIDLIDETNASTDHFELTEGFQSSQRSGVEYLESLENYPANEARTNQLLDLPSLVQLSQTSGSTETKAIEDRYFYALSPWSKGLLVDVKHGGLKRDLTQAFEYRHIFDKHFVLEPNKDAVDPDDITPVNYEEALYFIDDEVMTANGLGEDQVRTSGPNWSILRSYYRQYIPGSRSIKFSWNREKEIGEELTIRNSLDLVEHKELMADGPSYFAPFKEYEESLSDKTRTHLNKYTGWQHFYPDYSFSPGTSGLPYQTVPSEQGHEVLETRLISPLSDNYQLQSWVGPIISRLQLSFGINDGDYGLEIIVTPVLSLYNPYNTTITIEESKLFMGWNLNPIITIDVAGRSLPAPVSFGLREVMPTVSQGRSSYRIYSKNEAKGGTITFKPGETRYFGLNVDHSSYDGRETDNGVYQLWADTDDNGNIIGDIHQNGDYVYMTNYEPGRGGLVIPLELSYQHHPADNIGVTELYKNQDGNYGNNRPTKKRNWGLADEEIADLRLLSQDNSGNASIGGFTISLSLTTDFGAGFNIDSAGANRLQSISKVFADFDASDFGLYESQTFSSLSAASDQDQLLAVGFWLKTAEESNTPWRNLVDSNIRAISANSEWDGFNDTNGYQVLSTYTTQSPQTSRGILTNEYAEVQMDDPIRANGFWGNSNDVTGQSEVILFDRPRTPLLSLGNLQHANLGRYNFDPTYMVANSYANVRIPLDATESSAHSAWTYYGEPGKEPDYGNFKLFDTSYLVNEKLWDRYYFSGIVSDVTEDEFNAFKNGEPISGNQRYHYSSEVSELTVEELEARGNDDTLFKSLAAYLQIEGAFNVNSSSVDAWKALLGGLAQGTLPIYDFNAGFQRETGGLLISRFTWPYHGKVNLDENEGEENFWKGVREISEDELNNLAQAIVNQVKLRGPFLSVSDFINRAISDDVTGKSGALQAALDDPQLGVNTESKLSAVSLPAATDIPGSGFNDVFPETNMQAAGFPGCVLQGDVLQRIGPIITVRGDTFLIRSYGESVDKISGSVKGKAWCQAVVQRTAMPIEPDLNDIANELINPSSPMGREYKIIGFRWLSENEI
ncbi:hypothetical protein GCM10007047_23220 [Cerasicoccus arenae]|uniref:Uncharacterized protein n=2 Tax=Cerasicoccus arenae TaxID=424488 RepID=A0A8J3GEQ5_9BACT|nr:hypothetical protein GCM10007047_23220 [Cerasicoccus arenae]